MKRFRVEHTTLYRYAHPVSFGPHRLLLRPAEGTDLRVLAASIATSPAGTLRWTRDALGNAIAIATFRQRATELRIDSAFEVEHHAASTIERARALAPALPVAYGPEDQPRLGRSRERQDDDPKRDVDRWARRFVPRGARPLALDLLAAMVRSIHDDMSYEPREAEGTQSPVETLDRNVGACRDFAELMIEGCRSVGLAARLVAGYLYDPVLDRAGPPESGGATHAWAQVYLPGAGWVDADPTHGKLGNEHLIRVAIARDPTTLAPVSGTWIGFPGDSLGLEVRVHVSQMTAPEGASGAARKTMPRSSAA